MSRIHRLHSDLSRLGRESEMLDAVITMFDEHQLSLPAADGGTRHAVLERLAEQGAALAREVARALGAPDPRPMDDVADVRDRVRQAHLAVISVAARLTELPEQHTLEHRGAPLRAGDVVPERIAEVVLAHDDLRSAWTIEEADPDSVLDAVEAMVRRLSRRDAVPGLELTTEEGDRWTLGTGELTVQSDRENLAQWLARGVVGDLRADQPLPALPQWT